MTLEKVCPVVTRSGPRGTELLVFRHPLAGIQIVKGTREAGEALHTAALRELREESGLSGTVLDPLGWSSFDIAEGQTWHFLQVVTPPLPDRFTFHTADDGGHLFQFFWWPLQDTPGDEWHVSFTNALREIRAHIP